jgi:hypothetical protein
MLQEISNGSTQIKRKFSFILLGFYEFDSFIHSNVKNLRLNSEMG